MRIVNEELKIGRIFIDAGNCVGWSLNYMEIDPPVSYHSALAMGPMGFAVAGVVGAKLGAPDVPCITFGGMSKNYLVPGWRIGWGIVSGDAAAIKAYTEGIHRLLRARLCANHPEQYAIKPALEGPQDHLIEVRRKLRSRRDLTQKWCESTPRVSCVAPGGAFYAFPRIDIPESDEVFVKELIRQKHVMVVHGSGFGQKPGTQHFRIVFLPDEKTLTSAYAGIADFIQERYGARP